MPASNEGGRGGGLMRSNQSPGGEEGVQPWQTTPLTSPREVICTSVATTEELTGGIIEEGWRDNISLIFVFKTEG